jgi:hypothetical protein
MAEQADAARRAGSTATSPDGHEAPNIPGRVGNAITDRHRVCVAFALCELMTAFISDACPGDQTMVDRECTPSGVATEDAQNRRNLRATQIAEEERASDDAAP